MERQTILDSEADYPRQRLQFGPIGSENGSSVQVRRLAFRLALVLAMTALFASTAFESFWNKGDGSGTSRVQGTALIEPEGGGPNLPPGMLLAGSREESQIQDEPKEGDLHESGAERTRGEDLPFLLESLTDLDRDLPPALYYHFLDKARQASSDRLIADSRRDITFAHLYKDPRNEPRKYRGQLVGIRGTVRRALAFDMDTNAYGLKKRYELWIFTEDSGKFPWVVELTSLPEGFPLGTEIQEKVETAGFFLKLWAYRAQDGFRSAPILLGHGLVWNRTDLLRSQFDRQFGAFAFGFLGIFAVLIAGMVWRWSHESRPETVRVPVKVYDRLEEIPVDSSRGDGALSD